LSQQKRKNERESVGCGPAFPFYRDISDERKISEKIYFTAIGGIIRRKSDAGCAGGIAQRGWTGWYSRFSTSSFVGFVENRT